jgi:Zn finger protein HypA/HybF involved in hydrogenase expression
MNVEYIYCNSCGFEGIDVYAGYARTTAGDDLYHCPECNAECSDVDTGEE